MRRKIAAFSHSTFSSLRQRNFRLYFLGQGISLVGGWMQSVAQSWLVLHLTNSGAALGTVTALQFAPTLLIGPYAGVFADRVSKRRVVLATQTALGLLALAIGLAVATDVIRPWMVYVTAGLLGLVNAVDYPVRQAFVFDLAGPREVVSAVGLTTTAANIARVVGPALAGALIAGTGLAACFLLNAASFVAVLACLLLMRPAEFHGRVGAAPEGGLAEGLVYISRAPVVRDALLMMATVGVLTYEFSVTLPMLAKFAFAGSAAGLAYLMSAMGVGAAVGGLISAGRRGDGLGRLAVTAALFGLATALVGLSPTLHVAAVLMFFVGVFSARFVALSNSIVQLHSAPTMRTRAMALWSTAFMGSTFVGAPVLGWLGQAAGPRWPLAAGALGGAIAGAIGWWGRRHAETAETAELPVAAKASESAA